MDENFERFADKLGEYFMRRFVIPWMQEHGVVQSYRAEVVSVDGDAGTMNIQKPFDNEVTLPYGNGAAALEAGSQCLVFVLGDGSNGIVVSDGTGKAL